MTAERRYDVAVQQGAVVQIHRDLGWAARNRWIDFGLRHGVVVTVSEHRAKVRGEGTYR